MVNLVPGLVLGFNFWVHRMTKPKTAVEAMCLPHDLLNFGLGDVDGDADVLAVLGYFAAMAQDPTQWRRLRLTDSQQRFVRQTMREFVLGVPLAEVQQPIVRLLVAAIHSAATTSAPKASDRSAMIQRATGLLAEPRSLRNDEDLAEAEARAVFDPESDFAASKRRAMRDIATARGISETEAEAGHSLDDKVRNLRKAGKRRG